MRIAGYAAVFDHPDRGGDIVRRGAFAGVQRAGLPLLCQHDWQRRIGTVDDLIEDDRGLRVIATLARGHSAAPGDGLSIGYRVQKSINGTYRELLGVELFEVSLVATPLQPYARVIAVEAINQGS